MGDPKTTGRGLSPGAGKDGAGQTPFYRCRAAAESGGAAAQCRLAEMYFRGEGTERDLPSAVVWLRRARENGAAGAGERLAEAERALAAENEALGSLVAAGDADAQVRLGLRLLRWEDAEEDAAAVSLFQKAAGAGHARAMCSLAECLCWGNGAAQDPAEAFRLYRESAGRGCAAGLNGLGVCYSYGQGVGRDDAEALRCFRRAAKLGDAHAQYNLGTRDRGAAKRLQEAFRWYLRAAVQGYAPAQAAVGEIFYFEKEKYAEAAVWLRRAAEQGQAEAQRLLSSCYDCGDGVEADPEEALKWRRKADAQGRVSVRGELGICCRKGEEYRLAFATDRGKAEEFARVKALAEQGDAAAQNRLGGLYSAGEGVRANCLEANKWYKRAAGQGNADAQFSLGNCYFYGDGVPVDRAEAAEWYRKAAAQGHKLAHIKLSMGV